MISGGDALSLVNCAYCTDLITPLSSYSRTSIGNEAWCQEILEVARYNCHSIFNAKLNQTTIGIVIRA